jgi:hypothetical protein
MPCDSKEVTKIWLQRILRTNVTEAYLMIRGVEVDAIPAPSGNAINNNSSGLMLSLTKGKQSPSECLQRTHLGAGF